MSSHKKMSTAFIAGRKTKEEGISLEDSALKNLRVGSRQYEDYIAGYNSHETEQGKGAGQRPGSEALPMEIQEITMLAETNIDLLMADLLDATDGTETDGEMGDRLIKHSEQIRSLSNLCEKTGLFGYSAKKLSELKAQLEADTPPEQRLVKSWHCLLTQIVFAPTRLHRRGAVRLCIPLVANYLPPQQQASDGTSA